MRKPFKTVAVLAVMMICLSGCDNDDKKKAGGENITVESTTAEETTTETTTAEETTETTTEATTDQETTTEATTVEETTTEAATVEKTTTAEENSSGFVLVSDVAPDIVQEIRYYSDYNFIGKQIDGYEEPVAILTVEAATQLKEVNDELESKGYKLKIYDAYRPQSAVDEFVSWVSEPGDTGMKEDFYPEVDKSALIDQGYIGRKSGHSKGSTVDLTLVDANTERDVDMGGTFDYFGARSHNDYTGITDEQYANRMILKDAMTAHGFKPYSGEWWHFTLVNEPYPGTYFNFPVSSESVGR